LRALRRISFEHFVQFSLRSAGIYHQKEERLAFFLVVNTSAGGTVTRFARHNKNCLAPQGAHLDWRVRGDAFKRAKYCPTAC